MSKLMLFLMFTLLSFNGLSARSTDLPSSSGGVTYAPLDSQQMDNFNKEMQQAINNAQKKTDELAHFATRRDISPTWASKVQLKYAMIQLEVKKTLMNNFKDSEAIRSFAVREKLLKLLNSDEITTSDLADLQNLVLREKETIHEFDQSQKAVPAPAEKS